MAIKVPIHVIPAEPVKPTRTEYMDALDNMFQESVRVDPNFCTYQRWDGTDYTGPFSELKSGFLTYVN